MARGILGGFKRCFEVIGRVAGDARPDCGRGTADSGTIGFGARAGHADRHRVEKGKGPGNFSEMVHKLTIVEQSEVGRPQPQLPDMVSFERLRVAFFEDGHAPRGAGFDAQYSDRTARLLAHWAKYFRAGPFCKVNGTHGEGRPMLPALPGTVR